MKITENKKHELIIIFLCIAILLPIIIAGFYNRPSADDFSYSIFTHKAVLENAGIFGLLKSAWDTNVYYYNNWQGLYTSAFILALHPGIFGEKFYALSSLIVMACTYIPLLLATHIINRHFFRKSVVFSFSFSITLYTILIMWMPDINDGLYWYNGAMNYMPWAFINILSLCLLLEAYTSENKRRKIFFVTASTILAFLTSGGNHVTAFANILMLLFVCVLVLSKKKFFPFFPLAAACIGFIIMFTAPGTAVRQAYFESPGVVTTVIKTALHVHSLASEWFSIKWLLSLFVLTPAAIEFGYKNKDKFSSHTPLYIFLIAVYSIIVICGMFCTPYYAMKSFGMGRVTDVIWITFNFLSWLIYFMAIGWLVSAQYINADKIISLKHCKKLRLAVITICMCCMVIIFENSLACWPVKAASELLHGIPQSYAQEMDARAELYNDASLSSVQVSPIIHSSELLSGRDLGPDPFNYPNDVVGAYYGKPITLKEEQ